MREIVDARGLNCPEPVILTKQALDMDQVNEVLAIVDSQVALENITKMVRGLNLDSTVEEKGGAYYIDIMKAESLVKAEPQRHQGGTVILISSNQLGQGDARLGGALMESFFFTLSQFEGEIATIIFMNSGVWVSTEGSELLEYLQSLEANGVELLSCGTCLNFYALDDKLRAGSVSNMYTITEKMLQAQRLITL